MCSSYGKSTGVRGIKTSPTNDKGWYKFGLSLLAYHIFLLGVVWLGWLNREVFAGQTETSGANVSLFHHQKKTGWKSRKVSRFTTNQLISSKEQVNLGTPETAVFFGVYTTCHGWLWAKRKLMGSKWLDNLTNIETNIAAENPHGWNPKSGTNLGRACNEFQINRKKYVLESTTFLRVFPYLRSPLPMSFWVLGKKCTVLSWLCGDAMDECLASSVF